MQYKTTYFVLSLNNDISRSKSDFLHSQSMIEECRIQEGIIKESNHLENEVKKELIDFFDKLLVKRKIITETKVIPVEKQINKNSKGPIQKHKFKDIIDTLKEDEKKEILEQLQPHDIMNWNLDKIRFQSWKIDLHSVMASDSIKRLKSLKERLININQFKNSNRFTSDDELKLNKHLKEISSEGWILNSMQAVNKTLFEKIHSYTDEIVYGGIILEGFLIVWQKD